MANRMGPNDWRSATPATDDGHQTWIQNVNVISSVPATGPSASTVTSVDSSTASGTILAANSARLGAVIFNTDANALYLLLGSGTASSTNTSVVLAQNTSYEVPFGYTGIIVGVWAADGAGAAKVTEFT